MMKSFEYGDEEIGSREILYAVSSMVIGVGIFGLPRTVGSVTKGSDGWVSILLGGVLALFFAWLVAKLASRFPRQTFLQYTTTLVSKPVAIFLTILLAFHLMQFTAYEMRTVANISKVYLFDRTPVEVIALLFLLVVTYGVACSSVGLFRLNLLFLPIVLLIAILLLIMNIGYFEPGNLKPVFSTKWTGYFQGARETLFAFLGFEILLVYIAMTNQPEKTPKAVMIGMSIPLLLYLFVFIIVVGVFGHTAMIQLTDPTIEIAKEVEVPGEFFERFESLFFTIWIMTIFNTSALAFDASVLAFRSVFPKIKRVWLIFFLAPIIYLFGMMPPNLIRVYEVGNWLGFSGFIFAILMPTILFGIAKLRGIKGNA
ncbi:GerAB/ArcD/ProY family transporter [Ammoniphilus resinae]|uniref:Spore germination protein n=1 Tax=Ammoniphilus resinae TaxID=861532 RepID=A0ABS4GU67_9BACL|nr:endospore germination permease [Ammoniphilus resinae]MBP1933789.1 spore germination protein [Ammoniphilus resinae]